MTRAVYEAPDARFAPGSNVIVFPLQLKAPAMAAPSELRTSENAVCAEAAFIASLKLTVMAAAGSVPVAPAAGDVEVTTGAVRSKVAR